jgi:hypothetical protein|tara:strand:- start:385 stop:1116 length:732 start_codon:yes stop_codon:yes gene_type:complete
LNKPHYINSRYYQNERTLILNPTIPLTQPSKKSRKPSFLKSLLFVLVIFSVFIGYSAYAGGPIPDDGWVTEFDRDHITVRHHGNVTHGDDVFVILSKNDCASAVWITRIYTEAQNDFTPIIEKYLPYKLQNLSNAADQGYTTGQLVSVRPFMNGHTALVYFGEYPVSTFLKWFRSGDEYQIEIIKANQQLLAQEYAETNEDIVSIEPTEFFDIQVNSYYFAGFNKALVTAQKQCQDLGIIALS